MSRRIRASWYIDAEQDPVRDPDSHLAHVEVRGDHPAEPDLHEARVDHLLDAQYLALLGDVRCRFAALLDAHAFLGLLALGGDERPQRAPVAVEEHLLDRLPRRLELILADDRHRHEKHEERQEQRHHVAIGGHPPWTALFLLLLFWLRLSFRHG
jgi:hypothetical protein